MPERDQFRNEPDELDDAAKRAAKLQELADEQRGGRHDVDPVTARDMRIIANRQARGMDMLDDGLALSSEVDYREVAQVAGSEIWLATTREWMERRDGETDLDHIRRTSKRIRGFTEAQRLAYYGPDNLPHPDVRPVPTKAQVEAIRQRNSLAGRGIDESRQLPDVESTRRWIAEHVPDAEYKNAS